jgi:hypothetical protein
MCLQCNKSFYPSLIVRAHLDKFSLDPIILDPLDFGQLNQDARIFPGQPETQLHVVAWSQFAGAYYLLARIRDLIDASIPYKAFTTPGENIVDGYLGTRNNGHLSHLVAWCGRRLIERRGIGLFTSWVNTPN